MWTIQWKDWTFAINSAAADAAAASSRLFQALS
jgi:hypothetical protein